MSVSLVSRNVARKLLLVQLLVVIASGLLFSLKDPFWGVSAISGGLAVFLPNVFLFMIFARVTRRIHQRKAGWPWTFAFGEAFKVLAMLVLQVALADVGVTCGGVGGFKGGILADRYVGFGAGGSDTGTGCN